MRIAISALAMESSAGAMKAGVSRYCYGLIDALLVLRTKHHFVVFVRSDFEVPSAWREFDNVEFVPATGRFASGKTPWEIFAAPGESFKHKIDVWLSTAHAVPWRTKAKRALMVHDLFVLTHPQFFSRKQNLVVGSALRVAVRQADLLFANSHATAESLQKVLKVPSAKIRVTPLGPGNLVAPRDPSTVTDEDLKRIGVSTRRFVFTLCTLEPRKNLDGLLRALALMAEEFRQQGMSLAVAGARGWKDSPLFDLVNELGIGDLVTFLGYVDDADLPALFARCEAFVCPSHTEGFGIPVLEAAMLGAPIVSSREGALPEVAGDGAVYFDPADPSDMARAIQSVLTTPEKRSERVAAGFRQAELFDWDRTARLTLAGLEEIGGER